MWLIKYTHFLNGKKPQLDFRGAQPGLIFQEQHIPWWFQQTQQPSLIPASAPGCLSCATLDSYLECVIFILHTFTVRMIILRTSQGDWREKGLSIRQTMSQKKCLVSFSSAAPDLLYSQNPACFPAQIGSQSTLVCKHLLIEMSTY